MNERTIQAFQKIQNYSDRELEQFKSVCGKLLNRTFLMRNIYINGKGMLRNPDYSFLDQHKSEVDAYLFLLDWQLQKNEQHHYFYIFSSDDANHLNLNKTSTAILLALRLVYEENQDNLGLEDDAVCTVRDVLEKIVTDHRILPARPSMEDVKRAFTVFENHNLIQRTEGKFSQTGCKFLIYPTILSAVSTEKLAALVKTLQKEESDETVEESSSD